MKRSESQLETLGPSKHRFACALADRLTALPSVRSITFTGSFVDQPDLSGISDIDTVILVDELTPKVFTSCAAAAEGVSCSLLGLADHTLHLNTTFGPLKFDGAGRVVVHLMVYSVASHRTHVLKSPFTCLDWERSEVHFGPCLREIYPVLALQPRQLLSARRGLADYLDDLAACAIRFRRYSVEHGELVEVEDRKALDPRHQGEFAYHIVRNFVGNYAKVVTRLNQRLSTPDLLAFWRRALPASATFCEWFREIEALKRSRADAYPADTLSRTREFLHSVTTELEDIWSRRAVRHLFVRHARTALNDGRFLGQGRDPAIVESVPALPHSFSRVLSSPALRTRQTAAALAPGSTPVIDARVHEINYGDAEGLSLTELAAVFPQITQAWQRGEDPSFPKGENTAAVLARLSSFLADLPSEPTLVVTHNVVLRCLLGSQLGIPSNRWHLIPVSHGEPIEVLRLNGETYLNLTSTQIAAVTDAIIGTKP